MDEAAFWHIIEAARAADGGLPAVVAAVRRSRDGLSEPDAVGFDECWRDLRDRAYTARMLDGATILLGWIGDAGFDDFRGWLILQGQSTFERAVDDPDTLIELDGRQDELEPPAGLLLREIGGPAAWAAPAGGPSGDYTNLSDVRAVRAEFPKLYALMESRRCR